MFQGFTFKLDEFVSSTDYQHLMYYENLGRRLISADKGSIKGTLERYLSPDGTLSASEIEKDWFPAVQADVFLSHAHKDEEKVLQFAGYLSKHGLRPFVDSTVWGYADELLTKINEKYHVLRIEADGSTTYNYRGCNFAASQVYLILNGALEKMIDNTECVIFLDTPESMKISSGTHGTTNSAWIYSELLMTSLVRQGRRKEQVQKRFNLDESASISPVKITYDVNLSHLCALPMRTLNAAVQLGNNGLSILDYLYMAVPKKKQI